MAEPDIHVVGYSVSSKPARDASHLGGALLGTGEASHQAVLAASDVVVAWGVPDLERLLPTRRRPIVVSVIHGDGSIPYFRQIAEAHARFADHFVAVLDVGLACIPASRQPEARVIVNAVDPAKTVVTRPRQSVRDELGAGPDDVLVLWPHRYSEEKRGELAITVARMLPPWWRLAMVGSGWDKSHLESLVGGANVGIHDARDDMGNLFGAADIVLSTSSTEGSGLSVAEALLAGVPVVSTRVGIFAVAPHLASVVEVDDPPARIAAALMGIKASPETVRRRSEAAKRYVETHWGVDRFVSQWLALIREVAPSPVIADEALVSDSAKTPATRPDPAAPEPPLPSPVRQAVGLAGAGVQALASAAAPAPPEVVAERIRICESCEFFRASDRRCGGRAGCGCYVDIKAQLRDWDCPRERWPK